jgi:hypothetical protein
MPESACSMRSPDTPPVSSTSSTCRTDWEHTKPSYKRLKLNLNELSVNSEKFQRKSTGVRLSHRKQHDIQISHRRTGNRLHWDDSIPLQTKQFNARSDSTHEVRPTPIQPVLLWSNPRRTTLAPTQPQGRVSHRDSALYLFWGKPDYAFKQIRNPKFKIRNQIFYMPEGEARPRPYAPYIILHMAMDPATPTFNDSFVPTWGNMTISSQCSICMFDNPSTSFPTTIAHGY